MRYKLCSIFEMLKDGIVYLYFSFLSPIVLEFEKVNALFQSANPDPEQLSSEVENFQLAWRET